MPTISSNRSRNEDDCEMDRRDGSVGQSMQCIWKLHCAHNTSPISAATDQSQSSSPSLPQLFKKFHRKCTHTGRDPFVLRLAVIHSLLSPSSSPFSFAADDDDAFMSCPVCDVILREWERRPASGRCVYQSRMEETKVDSQPMDDAMNTGRRSL